MGTFIGFSILYLLLCGIVFFVRPNKDRESPYIFIFIAYGTLMMLVASPVSISKTIIDNVLYLIPFVALSFYMKYKIEKEISSRNKIVAKQVQFWDIPPEHVLSAYKDRIIKLDGRDEIKEVKVENFFKISKNGDKYLNPEIYPLIKKYRKFTKIRDTKYFDTTPSRVYKLVWEKIKALNKQNETNIDFEEVLKQNHYVLQFFLLELWERLTKSEAIGVANLKSVAMTEKDKHLVGALYSIEYMVGREGLELLAHYFFFKDRMKKLIN